jgi:hypothetical protein
MSDEEQRSWSTAAVQSVDIVLEQFQKEFGRLIELSVPKGVIPHPEVRVFVFFDGALDQLRRRELRRRVEAMNWHYSEWDKIQSWTLIAPMILVSASDIVYHVTRTVNVNSILKQGILPSNPAISTTGRADCEQR